jgi:hypothetical protein
MNLAPPQPGFKPRLTVRRPGERPAMNSKWAWVWRDAERIERFYSVGIEADGALFNPNGYPEAIVRAAIVAAEAHLHERRSKAAKKAATTRDDRQRRRVWVIARGIVDKQQTGPRQHCCVCGRGLGDPQSIARGIGSECWESVLDQVSIITAARARNWP